jgi:tRNA nucleotidyltransferase/poly(A) polymerase
MNKIPANFTYTETELKVFAVLQETAKKLGSQIRIAGGYVRDRLLGKQSNDIDVAIDNVTGSKFASHITYKTKPYVVAANPDQSKHLETTIVNLYGINVDLVNLRTETYSDSRIPTVAFGTPLQDAQRRDLTINALFLNITNPDDIFIEDYVGGIQDLSDKFAQTPLPAKQTFLDDPLRVLRVIRFCSRFGLKPHSDIIEAANSPEVQDAFKAKISRERIWSELAGQGEKAGFINAYNPYYAMELVTKFGFRDILFRPRNPDQYLRTWDRDQNNVYHDLNVWDHTMLAFKHLTNILHPDLECSTIRNLALILHDIGKCDTRYTQMKPDMTNSFHRHEERSAELAALILDELSAPIHIRDRVVRLIKEHCRFMNVDPKSKDSVLRRIIRDLEVDWENLLDVSLADAYGKLKKQNDNSLREEFEIVRGRMRVLLTEQKGQPKLARPINGHDLKGLGVAPGPQMGVMLAQIDEALLENPSLSRDEAMQMMKDYLNIRVPTLAGTGNSVFEPIK